MAWNDRRSDYCKRGMNMRANDHKAIQFKLTNHSSNRQSAYRYMKTMRGNIYSIDHA